MCVHALDVWPQTRKRHAGHATDDGPSSVWVPMKHGFYSGGSFAFSLAKTILKKRQKSILNGLVKIISQRFRKEMKMS